MRYLATVTSVVSMISLVMQPLNKVVWAEADLISPAI